MSYLRQLSREAGKRPPRVTSKADASRAIDELKGTPLPAPAPSTTKVVMDPASRFRPASPNTARRKRSTGMPHRHLAQDQSRLATIACGKCGGPHPGVECDQPTGRVTR